MSNIYRFQCPKCRDLLLVFVIYYIKLRVFWVLVCWLDKRSNYQTSFRALGNCNGHFSQCFDICRLNNKS